MLIYVIFKSILICKTYQLKHTSDFISCPIFQATGCRPSNEIYAKLLAVYLYENDLCSAKFLWKRIPEQAKNESVNLSQIWEVGKAMWNSNLSEVFRLIDTYEWSEHESDLMKAVKGIVNLYY